MSGGMIEQAVMMASKPSSPTTPPTRMGHLNSLYLLPILVAASLALLLIHLAARPIHSYLSKKFASRKNYVPIFDDEEPPSTPGRMPSQGLWRDFTSHIKAIGPWVFSFEVARAACLGALLGLSIYATVIAQGPESPTNDFDALKNKHKKHRKHRNKDPLGLDGWSSLEWQEFGVSAFYLYNLIISLLLLTIRSASRFRKYLSVHIHLLLFCAIALYSYRDIFPLGTYHYVPVDTQHAPAWLTWSRYAVLATAAVVIPMCRPRRYKPVDPANPQTEPHPEQTVPLINFIFFMFLDKLILKAWKTPSLPYDELPPMTDYDRAAYLAKVHMHKLDPVIRKQRGLRPRHLIWGIIGTFWREASVMMSMVVIKSSSEFAGPIGINRLLTYLQKGESSSEIRPWVWILLLFLGPTIGTIAFQLYIFTSTRAITRAEAIFTQLIFDQALRIKMRDDVDSEKEAGPLSGADTPAILVEDTSDLVHGLTTIEETTSENAGTLVGQAQGNGSTNGDASSTSSKGKKKAAAAAAVAAAEGAASKSHSKNIVGKINNLMGSDIDALVEGRDVFLVVLYSPLQIIFAVIFLWQILGWSSLVGMLCIVITLPIPGYLSKFMHSVQIELMKASDARLAKVTEAINALKMLKLFAWEERMNEQLALKREIELKLSRKKQFINQMLDSVNFVLPVITMVASYGLYTTVQGQTLTAATVFSSLSVFELIREQMFMVTWLANTSITAAVSIKRLNEYLNKTELLDRFEQDRETKDAPTPNAPTDRVSVKDASFTWNKPDSQAVVRNFRLKIDDLQFEQGKLNIVAGPTGSGKTSLLMALLGEMVFQANSSDAYFTLPRSGGVSYVAQESWVFSGTVKENILFGTPFDEQRYNKVLHQCALEKDLEIMVAGDETELGEKGLNASGGQKARISLARAIYSLTDIVILDDVLSALDVHTSRWIVDKCFKGDLLSGRTVILVTHHVAMVAPVAGYIVHLSMNGTIESQGPVSQALMVDEDLREAVTQDANEVELETKMEDAVAIVDTKESGDGQNKIDAASNEAGKLVADEEKSEGRISRPALLIFFKALGGPIFWTIFISTVILGETIQVGTNYWLGIWARAYANTLDPKDVSVTYYLGIYIAIVALQILVWNIMNTNFVFGSIRASRTLHARLVASIFSSTLRFLDTTPSGRIIARFTKDIKTLDGSVARLLAQCFELSYTLLLRFGLTIVFVPWISPIALAVGVIGGVLGELYIHGQLAIKREMSNAKSPLFSAMAAQVQGITSIRAYGAENKVRLETQTRIDKYTRAANSFYLLNRWITIRMDLLGAIFSASLAAFLTYSNHGLDPSIVGYALTLGISAAQYILWLVRLGNEFEVQGNSVERVAQYLDIPHEPAATEAGKPPAYWPASGTIVLQGLSAKYSDDGPNVLNNISLNIASGERVGIVGRTGSGKSTTALALLRMIPTTGAVIIDGIDTKTINIEALRSNVSCIPQDPILLEGTLRYNLDPFGDMGDAELYDALQASGLGLSRQSVDGMSTPTAITIDTEIAAGGGNLSQGQRQLVALARALLRKTKVLVLDEATASVDHATDNLVQKAIRNVKDTTIITIAHRLSTIMDYDKIIVLDAGQLVEFDSPKNLLAKEDGKLRALVNDSGDIEALEKLAQGGSKSE